MHIVQSVQLIGVIYAYTDSDSKKENKYVSSLRKVFESFITIFKYNDVPNKYKAEIYCGL